MCIAFLQGVITTYYDNISSELYDIPHEYHRPSVHKSQMAICLKCWKLVKITEVKPRKVYYSEWDRWAYEVESEDLMKKHWDQDCIKQQTFDKYWNSMSDVNRFRIISLSKLCLLTPPPLPPKSYCINERS